MDEALISSLYCCGYLVVTFTMREMSSLSVGQEWAKIHLVPALGIEAIEQYYRRTRSFSTIELINARRGGYD